DFPPRAGQTMQCRKLLPYCGACSLCQRSFPHLPFLPVVSIACLTLSLGSRLPRRLAADRQLSARDTTMTPGLRPRRRRFGSLSFRGICIVPPCQSLLHPVPPPAAAGLLSAVAADGSCPNSEVRQPREDVPADPQSANACRHGNLLSSSQHLHHWGSFGAAEPFLSRLETATLVHADNLKAVGHS